MKISLGTTYYNNPEQILEFVKTHVDFVDELIIVDDGSQHYPLNTVICSSSKIRLFRVKKDYGFNSHGCRNLIMSVATNDWVVLLDSDRKFIYPEIAFNIIKDTKLNPKVRYRFWVHVMELTKSLHESVNDYLIHKDHFFSVGGYDEELIGVRSGDREFFKQLLTVGSEKTLHGVDIIFTRMPSVQLNEQKIVSNYDRKLTPELHQLIQKRIQQPNPHKPILTFEWEEIT